MGILRVTLDSLDTFGGTVSSSPPDAGGPAQGSGWAEPSLAGGGVLAPGLHLPSTVQWVISAAPASLDLVDPTDATPSGWGWTVWVRTPGAAAVPCVLTPDNIAALPQSDGVRTARLEDHLSVSAITAQGGLVRPGRGVESMTVDDTTGELSATMTDGTVLDAPGLPAAIEALVSAPVAADAAAAASSAEAAQALLDQAQQTRVVSAAISDAGVLTLTLADGTTVTATGTTNLGFGL